MYTSLSICVTGTKEKMASLQKYSASEIALIIKSLIFMPLNKKRHERKRSNWSRWQAD